MSLSATITARVQANLSSALDLATAAVPLDKLSRLTWTSGTGTNQADKIWHDQRTLAASANEDLDLAGGLTDALGATLTLAELRLLMVTASSANTNNVVITRPAANGVPLFSAASDAISVRPGGVFLWAGPLDGGVTVTAGTGDLINISNSGAGTSVTYDIVIIGASA